MNRILPAKVFFYLPGLLVFILSCSQTAKNNQVNPDTRGMAYAGPSKYHFQIVEIHHKKFVPPEVTVSKGDTVIWVNQDDMAHDVTEKNKAWTSSPMGTSASWSMTVNQPWDYYCFIHPEMTGKIHLKK